MIKQILTLSFLFILLFIITILTDYLLHLFGLNFLDYYFGILGSFLILFSFIYSLRKRMLIKISSPKKLLILHEYLSWLGALFILVHAGIHLNALLAWIAAFSMIIAVISGLTGKFILKKAQAIAAEKKKSQGDLLFFDSLAIDIMKNWRKIHIPVTSVFFVLAIMHIIIATIFGLW